MEIFHKKGTKEYQKITFSVENDFKIGLKTIWTSLNLHVFNGVSEHMFIIIEVSLGGGDISMISQFLH